MLSLSDQRTLLDYAGRTASSLADTFRRYGLREEPSLFGPTASLAIVMAASSNEDGLKERVSYFCSEESVIFFLDEVPLAAPRRLFMSEEGFWATVEALEKAFLKNRGEVRPGLLCITCGAFVNNVDYVFDATVVIAHRILGMENGRFVLRWKKGLDYEYKKEGPRLRCADCHSTISRSTEQLFFQGP